MGKSKGKKNRGVFLDQWLKMPKYKNWVQRVPLKPLKVHCKLCKMNLSLKQGSTGILNAHMQGNRHQKNQLKITNPGAVAEERAEKLAKLEWVEEQQCWVCKICQKKTRSQIARRKHANRNCANREQDNPSWRLGWERSTMSCRYCHQKFSRQRGVRKHIQKRLCPNLPDWNTLFCRQAKPQKASSGMAQDDSDEEDSDEEDSDDDDEEEEGNSALAPGQNLQWAGHHPPSQAGAQPRTMSTNQAWSGNTRPQTFPQGGGHQGFTPPILPTQQGQGGGEPGFSSDYHQGWSGNAGPQTWDQPGYPGAMPPSQHPQQGWGEGGSERGPGRRGFSGDDNQGWSGTSGSAQEPTYSGNVGPYAAGDSSQVQPPGYRDRGRDQWERDSRWNPGYPRDGCPVRDPGREDYRSGSCGQRDGAWDSGSSSHHHPRGQERSRSPVAQRDFQPRSRYSERGAYDSYQGPRRPVRHGADQSYDHTEGQRPGEYNGSRDRNYHGSRTYTGRSRR